MSDVKIYVTEYCGYCKMAERLLTEMNIEYEEIDVTHDAEQRMELVERTGKRTVPQIFIHDQPIGGFTDLKALKDSGKLAEMFPD